MTHDFKIDKGYQNSNRKKINALTINQVDMKKIIASIILVIVSGVALSQAIYKIKTDSLLVTNDSCTAELNLENSTRNIKGFLYNRGNGRTEFRQGIIKNDSLYIIGNDTLKLSAVLSKLIAENGLTKSGDTIRLGGALKKGTTIMNIDSSLTFLFNDGSYQKIGINRGYTGVIEQYGKGRFQTYNERSVSATDWWNTSQAYDTLAKTYSTVGANPGESKLIAGTYTGLTYNPYPQIVGNNSYRFVLNASSGISNLGDAAEVHSEPYRGSG